MKVIVEDWYTEIYLNSIEINILCKPGEGKNTCVWLVCGSKGFECTCKNKPSTLVDKFKNGDTIAKRDGCYFIDDISPIDLGMGEHIINLPEGYSEE